MHPNFNGKRKTRTAAGSTKTRSVPGNDGGKAQLSAQNPFCAHSCRLSPSASSRTENRLLTRRAPPCPLSRLWSPFLNELFPAVSRQASRLLRWLSYAFWWTRAQMQNSRGASAFAPLRLGACSGKHGFSWGPGVQPPRPA